MIQKIYSQIFKKNKLDDINIFLKNYTTYEEIPLINRYEDVSFIETYLNKEDVALFLLNISFFYLNIVIMYAKKTLTSTEFADFFIAVSICDLEEQIEEVGFFIPHFIVSRKKSLFTFITKENKIDLQEYNLLEGYLKKISYIGNLDLYKTKSIDRYGETNRIYIIPKN
jgi:hypothetical protein